MRRRAPPSETARPRKSARADKAAPRDQAAALRRRAEAALVARRKGAQAPESLAAATRIRHELEVHQIELEMQNAELRRARDEIEEALEAYTDLYDLSPAGYFSLDEAGVILEGNLTGAALLGVARSLLAGRSLGKFVVPASQPTFSAFLRRVFEKPERQSCELSLRGAGGNCAWVDVQGTSAATLKGGRRWCRVTVSDVTSVRRAEEAQLRAELLDARNRELDVEIARRAKVELALKESERKKSALLSEARLLQEQLRQLARGVLHAQEEERRRVSRDLHDVVAQSVVELSVQLALLRRSVAGTSAAARKRIEEPERLLAVLLENVHAFCRDLRPPLLDDLGLNSALAAFAREFAGRTGIDVRFTPAAAADRLDGTARTVLYRVAQEALANVAKHARASHVDVRVQELPGFVCMDIADDGEAFAVARAFSNKRSRRLGLLGMRERLEMVGGSFTIESKRGTGTRIRASIPLSDAEAPR